MYPLNNPWTSVGGHSCFGTCRYVSVVNTFAVEYVAYFVVVLSEFPTVHTCGSLLARAAKTIGREYLKAGWWANVLRTRDDVGPRHVLLSKCTYKYPIIRGALCLIKPFRPRRPQRQVRAIHQSRRRLASPKSFFFQ